MTNRRSFFKRFAAFAAVLVLAPEIAFNRKLEIQEWKIEPLTFWLAPDLISRYRSEAYKRYLEVLMANNPEFSDAVQNSLTRTSLDWENAILAKIMPT